MLDIKYILENKAEVKKAAKNKGIDVDIDKLLELDGQRRKLNEEIDAIRKKRNEIANLLQDDSKRTQEVIKEGKELKEELKTLEKKYTEIKEDYQVLMGRVPLVPSADTPIGEDEAGNVEVSTK